MQARIIFFFSILLFVSSCKEDDTSQSLELHTPQQVDNTIILNWAQTSVPGFEYYMVMRASDGQNYQIINDISTPGSNAFHKEITTFEDGTYPLEADTLYYKIMAVGKETASSRNVCYKIENPVTLIKGNILNIYYVEETGKISVTTTESNGYTHKLKVFDPKIGQFSSNEANINLSYSNCWYFWGKYNEKSEFYSYDGNYTIYVYDASTSQQIATLKAPWSGYDPFTGNNKGKIYILGYYLYLIDRATDTYTQYQPQNYFDADDLYYNSKENKLYAVDYGKFLIFNLNETGEVTGEDSYQLANNYSTPLYIENSSLFVVETNAGIKILDMNSKTLHNTELTQMPRLALLKNNVIYTSIYSDGGIISIGANPQNYIHQLSADNFKLIKSTPVRVFSNKMVADNEYLYVLGQYGYDTYLVEKIKLDSK
jgi:hypothetical protein